MTQPRQHLIWMAIGLVAVVALAWLLSGPIYTAFLHNPALNSGIFVVLLIGMSYIFWQVIRLYPEIEWIERLKRNELGGSGDPEPRLLAPMAAMVRERTGRLSLSTAALRSLLDSISSRLDESRDISRYFIGLMVFLGLLGTFWGLLGTISGVAEAIGAISVTSGGDVASLFGQLKAGLEKPLAGMGTAFSASLFGLSGSLVLGYLELQASQAQNRFFNELEDWLAERTRLTSAGSVGDGDQSVPVYIQALLEQTADNLENLQRIVSRGEDSRNQANQQMNALVERLGGLTDQMRTESQLMMKLAESQTEMRPVIARLAEAMQAGRFGIDEQSRTHLRNMDSQISRLADESIRGRQSALQELRNDIKKLADSQIDMRPLLSRLQDLLKGGGFGLDDQSRQHLRNLDGQLGRLMEDVARGRQESVQELRSEIKVLARTIAALADEGERR
jgi:gas vesicle protein